MPGPEAFGFLALFTSITSIIGVIACMHYEMRIMLPKTDEETANLPALCLLSVAVISGLTVPALYFGGDAPLPSAGRPGLVHTSSWFRRLSLPAGVSCAEQPELAWQPFQVTGVARVASSLAITGTQLGTEFVGDATGENLIGVNLIGVSIST